MPTPNPTSAHPDDQLPAPLRWATRLFSSYWMLVGLTVLVAGYVAVALIPVGRRYVWQASWIDATQVGVLRWTPFHAALLLLVCVLAWTTLRRVAWRRRNVGVFVLVIGVALALVGLSTGWRYQTRGLLAVNAPDVPGVLQTRYLDPAQRVLFVQIGQNPPQQVPLDGLPRWHDASPGSLTLPLHQHPGLRSQLEFRAQVHAVAYLADGELEYISDKPGSGVMTPSPTPISERGWPLADCPTNALLALRFTANSADGPTSETLVWLPFNLAEGQRVMPTQSYDIPGIGPVRLAFTLASKDLGFAVGVEPHGSDAVTLNIADTDPVTRQVIPPLSVGLRAGHNTYYRPTQPEPAMRIVMLTAGPFGDADHDIPWVKVASTPAMILVWLGVGVAALGVLLALMTRLVFNKRTHDATA